MSSTFLIPFLIALSIINLAFLALTIWAALQLRDSDWWIVFLVASIMGLLYEVDYREFTAAQPLSASNTLKCAARDLATALSTVVLSRCACVTSTVLMTATPPTAPAATALTAQASAVINTRTIRLTLPSFVLRPRALVLALLQSLLPAFSKSIHLVLLVALSLLP